MDKLNLKRIWIDWDDRSPLKKVCVATVFFQGKRFKSRVCMTENLGDAQAIKRAENTAKDDVSKQVCDRFGLVHESHINNIMTNRH
jgi:hypothetical protein